MFDATAPSLIGMIETPQRGVFARRPVAPHWRHRPLVHLAVPPILFETAIYLSADAEAAPGAPGVTRITVAAAMRACGVVQAKHRQACTSPTDEPAPRTLLPISRRSRLAADIAAGAGRLLPGPFTPYRVAPAGLLSVAVLRHSQVAPAVPPLAVSRGDLLYQGKRKNFHFSFSLGTAEESGSSSGALLQRRRARCTLLSV